MLFTYFWIFQLFSLHEKNKNTVNMAVHIQVNSPDLKLDENCVVHSMPCKINHDGQANVSGFFSPYIENKELDDSSDGGNFLS